MWQIPALAALAVPRVFVHDLHVDVGPFGMAVLAIGPMVVWVYVVLRARVPSPVLTLLLVGLVYGGALGGLHLLMWDQTFDDDAPDLRGTVFVSSIATGAGVGVLCGLVAKLIRHLGSR